MSALVVALALFACATIDPPAAFEKPEATTDPSFDDGGPCGQVVRRRVGTGGAARLHGDPAGAQALCVTLDIEVPGATNSKATFCVAGDLDDVTVPTVRDVLPNRESCAYCADIQTGCTTTDGGPTTCDNAYAPREGRVRIVRFGRNTGDDVWIDVGDLVADRLVQRDGGTPGVEPVCLFADGLTFQGKVVAATCAPGDTSFECRIASTASSRFP